MKKTLRTKHYIENNPDSMSLRDHLAFDRTLLALERTVLSYARTVIVSFGAGLTIVKLFPEDSFFLTLAYFAFFLAFVSVVLGIWTFVKVGRKLEEVYKSTK